MRVESRGIAGHMQHTGTKGKNLNRKDDTKKIDYVIGYSKMAKLATHSETPRENGNEINE